MTVKNAGTLGRITGRGVSGIPVLPVAPVTGVPVVAPGGDVDAYLQKLLGIQSDNLIGLWPMGERSGSVAVDESPEINDGAYTSVTLNNSTFKNGRPVGLWDGANDYNDIYSAGFDADFDGNDFTVAIWAKVSSAAVWTDGTRRRVITILGDASNFLYMDKRGAANQLETSRLGSGVNKAIVIPLSTTDWFHFAMTYDGTADELKYWINGAQTGGTKTLNGAWVGALSATQTVLGAETITPTTVWDGWLAYMAVWTKALTPAEVLEVATV